jgi:hypothetical protein
MTMLINVQKVREEERVVKIYVGEEIDDLARRGMIVMQTGDEVSKAHAVLQTRLNAHRAALIDLGLERDPFDVDVEALPADKAKKIMKLRAELRMNVIRTFEASSDVSFSALLCEVMQAIREEDWNYLDGYADSDGQPRSPTMFEWIEDSFITPKWRTIIKNYLVKVIAPLDRIEVLDEKGERVTPERFIIERPSFIEEVGTLGSKLAIEGPQATEEDIIAYREAMRVAATQKKEALRDMMSEKGWRNPRFEPEDGQYYLYECVDPVTGEKLVKFRFVYETTREPNANWFIDQTRRRVRFGLPQTITPEEAQVI